MFGIKREALRHSELSSVARKAWGLSWGGFQTRQEFSGHWQDLEKTLEPYPEV